MYNDIGHTSEKTMPLTEREIWRREERRKDIESLRRFRPIDDIFMRIIFRNNLPLAEYVLQVITGKEELHLTKEETQKDLVRLVGTRGLCLDVHGVDNLNQQYDLEIQRADKGARPERARYHASALDVENLQANQQFEELPTTYIIFITENDIFKKNKALYPIGHINMETGESFNDRQYVLYVNASYKGDDPLGRLMHDFLCSDPEEMLTPILAEKVRFLKTDPKGVDIMCEEMEKMIDEVEKRTTYINNLEAIRHIMEGLKFTAQQAMDLLKIPAAEQEKYIAKL